MEPERYLQLIEQDAARLAAAGRRTGLDTAIPCCPGWTVGDCVAHTAEVYQHKVACVRLGRSPSDGYEQAPPAGVDLLDWFDSSAALLLAELRARGPAAPAYTWWPPDQTVGFWYRRMAQETAVHRLDVEDAARTPGPIDAELALDGIDEVLDLFISDGWDTDVTPEEWGDVDPHAGEGRSVAVRSGGRAWRSTLGPATIALERLDGAGDARGDATVSGDPESVLLWLWGRRGDDVVDLGGDPAVLGPFRDRLVIATQ
jgi:uncharacterized protein (TIGR03083 family)